MYEIVTDPDAGVAPLANLEPVPVTPSGGRGRIYRPVNAQAVYQFFGIAPYLGRHYDTSHLCSNAHGKINPASKIKPIRYAGYDKLTESQFKGTIGDNTAEGVYWGLRCRMHGGSGDGANDQSRGWPGLHYCNWEYLAPRPGTDFSRLSDFDGYDDGAVFNPTGYVSGVNTFEGGQAWMYYDQPDNLPCTVNCRTTGENFAFDTSLGVNLQEVAGAVNAGNPPDLGKWYPCVLISGVNDAGAPVPPHMVRALAENRDTVTEANKYQPLRNSSGAWWGGYVAETFRDVGTDIVKGGLGIDGPCRKMVTLFVTDQVKSAAQLADYTKWREVSTEALPVNRIFTVPGAAGVIVEFKRAYAQGMTLKGTNTFVTTRGQMLIGGGTASGGRIAVSVLPDFVMIEPDNKPDREATYTFHVALYQSLGDQMMPAGGGQFVISGANAYPSDDGLLRILQIDIETDVFALGMAPGSASSTTFDLDWWVTSDKAGTDPDTGQPRRLNSGSTSVTHYYK